MSEPGAPLVARGDELDQIVALLAAPGGRLVSITGRGGVGKTRLAVEVIRRLNEERPGTAAMVALAAVADPALVMHQIASTLGVRDVPGAEGVDVLASELAGRGRVLALDSFEHLTAAVADLQRLLAACPDLRLLVTTQAPLKLRAERVLRLGGLDVPAEGERDVGRISAAPSVALYCDRARALDASFNLHDGNAPDVAALCRELEGLPLAIELAAARATTLPAGVVLARLRDHGLDVLRADYQDAPERHRALRSAIAWTYELLAPDAQRLLRRLSVIAGSFDLDDAEALGGDQAIDALSALVDLHLVDPAADASPINYRVPTSIREFAAECAVAAGEQDGIELAWLRSCAARARLAAVAVDTFEEPDAREWIAANADRLASALAASLERGDAEPAVDILCALVPHWVMRGMPGPYLPVLDRTLDLAESTGLATSEYAEALAGSALLMRWRPGAAARQRMVDGLERAEVLAASLTDVRARLHVLAARVAATAATADHAQGRQAAADGLALAEQVRSAKWIGRFQVWSGMIAHQQGDPSDAVRLGVDGLERARRTNDERMIFAATMLLLPLKDRLPRGGAELPTGEELVDLAHRACQAQLLLAALPMLSLDELWSGDLEAAAVRCAESLRMLSAHPASPLGVYSLMTAAQLADAAGEADRAARFHGVIRHDVALMASSIPPGNVAKYEQMVDRLEQQLGAGAFEAALTAGELGGRRAALEQALAWVEDLVDARAKPTDDRLDVPRRSNVGPLSQRQKDVLGLMALGLSNKEIAGRLGITEKTVEHHTEVIYRKLRVRGRTEATAWAHRNGLADR